jgi:hypothetical protein
MIISGQGCSVKGARREVSAVRGRAVVGLLDLLDASDQPRHIGTVEGVMVFPDAFRSPWRAALLAVIRHSIPAGEDDGSLATL